MTETNNRHKDCYLIYNRKSTDDPDNQRNSLAYQKQRNLEYARREHLRPAADLTMPGFCKNGIIEESHSAFKQQDEFVITPEGSIQYRILRRKFLILINLLQSMKVRGVIFLCWDRASRNEQDDLIIKKLIRLGSDIRFAEASYDQTSAGEFHQDMDGVVARHYSRNISEKVRNSQKKLRAERRCIYRAPIGYLDRGSDNKPFDPERAPTVKRVFELSATGEWSIRQLARWAREQGLTQKPYRRPRRREEIDNDLDKATIPKIARPVSHKTIEQILPNPFYIGKVKIGDRYEDSTAHQALIDTALFLRVQKMLKQRRVSAYYFDKPFYTYRELVRCGCGRTYTPYRQKGNVYYRSRCKEGCENPDPNLTGSEINKAVQQLMGQLHLTNQELAQIDSQAEHELAAITEKRDKTFADLQARRRVALADLDYIAQNRITLLRTGSMDPETIRAEELRLEAKLAAVDEELTTYAGNAPEMLTDVITFSELTKNASLYFGHALDSEQREIASLIFTELIFMNRQLVGYVATDGFKALLSRINQPKVRPYYSRMPISASKGVLGGVSYLFSELPTIYQMVRRSMEKLSNLPYLSPPGTSRESKQEQDKKKRIPS